MTGDLNTLRNGDHVAIIGGGVIGGMCAWYLRNEGFRVTIVEKNVFGSACSHGNCGYVCPSHVLPLPQPGAVASTLRAMMRPNSPFAIRPRMSRDFVSWFWNFFRRCNASDMLSAAHPTNDLLQSSMRLYKDLVYRQGFNCEWQERGLLFVFDDEESFDKYTDTDAFLRREFGVAAQAYDSQSLLELEPALKPGLGGGWHYADDCHLRPDVLMRTLREQLESRGVTFVESAPAISFATEDRAAKAINTSIAPVEADHFVVATGATTPFFNDALGFRVPIQPGKGYSITMPCPQRMPTHPMIFQSSHVAITPMETGYRIGSTMEFVGYDTSINKRRLGLLTSEAAKYLVDPVAAPIEEEWFGWRPMTFDGKPIIGRSPAMSNVWIAAGHSMLGLSMATGTGKLIAELVSNVEPHIDPAPFRAERFL